MRIVGLVESDWPDAVDPASSIPRRCCAARLAGRRRPARRPHARASTISCSCPAREIAVSAFTLEDDAIVPPSPFVEERRRRRPPIVIGRRPALSRIFDHEALSRPSARPTSMSTASRIGVAGAPARVSDAALTRVPRRHGPRDASVYAVSHVERYLECPFKYFAAQVLRLDEEREDESGLTPQERGQLLHGVFEAFFGPWQARGRWRVTTGESSRKRSRSSKTVAEQQLLALPEGGPRPRADLSARLGGRARTGRARLRLRDRAGHRRSRAAARIRVRRSRSSSRPVTDRRVAMRGKADRIDLLADGTLRVIDYKLGRAPKPARALQLPVYGVCAQQALEGRHGRSWPLASAGYVAFKEKNAFVELGGRSPHRGALREGQARFLDGGRRASSAASSRPIPTSRACAPAADSPTSAERTTSAMSDRDRVAQPSLFDVLREARGISSPTCGAALPRRTTGPPASDNAGASRSGCRRARLRRRPPQQRRAGGIGRHGQDVGARHALRQPAQGRGRSGQHPGDHVHAEGGGRDARAHLARAAPRRRAVANSIGRAGSTLRDRLGDIAISTIDAFCLSLLREFPLEADLDPGFEMADETEVPRLDRRVARSSRCGSSPAWPRDDPTSRWCSRSSASRAHARGWRRCSIAGSSRGTRSTASSRAARGSDRRRSSAGARPTSLAGRCCGAAPGGLAAFLADGPMRIRATSCSRAISRGLPRVGHDGDAAIRALLDRVARALSHERTASRERAAGSIRTTRPIIRRRARRSVIATAVFAASAARRGRGRAFSAATSTWCSRAASAGCSPSPSTQYRQALDERSVARLFRRAAARARPVAPDGRVFAEPLPARVALPPRPRGRVPGHEPGAVGARVAPDPVVGGRARTGDATRRSSSSAIASSRFTASATPRSR